MKAVGASLALLLVLGVFATATTLHVAPHPGPGEISLENALELAQPGDEIVLAAGGYSGGVTIDRSVRIAGDPGAEIVSEGPYGSAITVTGGRVTIIGLPFTGEGTGIEVTGNADLMIERCRFSGLDVGAKLNDGRGKIVDSDFRSCATAVTADVRLEIEGCSFSENEVGIDAYYGASVRLSGCSFTSNERAIIGEVPCRVDGSGNRFSKNGLDLIGAVSPKIRPHERGSETTVNYPSTAYPSLQAAVDAVQTGGKLVVTRPFAESAVIDRSINVIPAGSPSVTISGHRTGEKALPVFSLIGDVNVDIRHLQLRGGIAVGPEAKLSLTDVSILDTSLALTGNSELSWRGGSGGLRVAREAVATIEGVTLTGEPGVQGEDLGVADLTHCIISSPSLKTALAVEGGAHLTLAGSFVVGALTLKDRARVRVNDSSIGGLAGSNKDRSLFGVELAGPADLSLDNVDIGSAWVGIYFAADAEISLSRVKIHDTHVGMGIENRVSEFDFPTGLWTPKIVPTVLVEGSGVALSNNDVDFAPAVTQKPWPLGLYDEIYGDRTDHRTQPALDRLAQAAKVITSCHLRVRDSYSWTDKVEEIYYVPPDKLRIDTYESDKLTETVASDGHTLWDYKCFLESATKVDLDALQKEHPDSWPEILREKTRFGLTFADFYLKSAIYLGTEQIDGEGTYVFSGLPIREAISDAVAMKIWISPQDGLWRKIEYYTTTGKAFLTKTVLQAETNASISDGTFKPQLPKGTDVRDETRQVQQELGAGKESHG